MSKFEGKIKISRITPEQAEKELRESISEYEAPAKHLKIRSGKHTHIAVNNVVGVGLAAGFIEPLEATGITFTTHVVRELATALNTTGNILNDKLRSYINQSFDEITNEILAFVWAHYKFSTRNDTEFWKAVQEQKVEDLPESAKIIIEKLLTEHPFEYRLKYHSMFSVPQWFSMLHAGGALDQIKTELTPAEEKYGKYFCNTQNERVKLAMNLLENHYTHLKGMYNANSI